MAQKEPVVVTSRKKKARTTVINMGEVHMYIDRVIEERDLLNGDWNNRKLWREKAKKNEEEERVADDFYYLSYYLEKLFYKACKKKVRS